MSKLSTWYIAKVYQVLGYLGEIQQKIFPNCYNFAAFDNFGQNLAPFEIEQLLNALAKFKLH